MIWHNLSKQNKLFAFFSLSFISLRVRDVNLVENGKKSVVESFEYGGWLCR